jgi:hypothetical protein
MRENRPYGSEGGEGASPSLPLSDEALLENLTYLCRSGSIKER